MTHFIFDITAVITSILVGMGVYHKFLRNAVAKTVSTFTPTYFTALSIGSILGAFILGTGNLLLSGSETIGRSIIGALLGSIITIELYKYIRNIRGSTGYFYVVPFSALVVIGRLGCYFTGLDDYTYGIETTASWAVDFGDGIMRHPVQLYESISMFIFLILAIVLFKYNTNFMIKNGFYLCVGFYAIQRFFWEFLKPYASLYLSLNIFQYCTIAITIYSIFMMWKVKNGYHT